MDQKKGGAPGRPAKTTTATTYNKVPPPSKAAPAKKKGAAGGGSAPSAKGTKNFCRNRPHGCPAAFPASSLPDHERQCEHRPVQCPRHADCKERVPAAKVAEHLRRHHKLPSVHGGGSLLSTFVVSGAAGGEGREQHEWDGFVAEYDGREFHCGMRRIRGRYFASVHLAGAPERARDYSARVSLEGPDKKKRVYVWSGVNACSSPQVETISLNFTEQLCRRSACRVNAEDRAVRIVFKISRNKD